MAEAEWKSVLGHLQETAAEPAWEPFGNPERRRKKMERIDALPADVKSVVHDFGWLTVKVLMEAGVTEGKKMRMVIKVLLTEHSHEYRAQFRPRKYATDSQ